VNAFCSACGQPVAQGVRFCRQCGAPTTSPAATAPQAAREKLPGVRCKTCDVGLLSLEKKYRMSTPVVAIGYILLIPSILGIIFSVFLVFITGHAGSTAASAIRDSAASTLQEAGVAAPIVQKVVSSRELTEVDKATLSVLQKATVERVQSSVAASQIGAGAGTAIVGGFGIFFGVVSFVGGLLGWLLVMKKKVLHCTNCGAVVAAS
jgi:hypothetical protein